MAIDDFAFRKGYTYGTLICDLRTHHPIAMLNSRNASPLKEWLKKQPTLYLVTRDNYQAYKSAILSTSPSIVQVSDRFHLVKNLFNTMADALIRLLPVRIEVYKNQAKVVNKQAIENLTLKEQERWALIQDVQKSYGEGFTINELVKEYQLGHKTIQTYIETKQPVSFYREKKISKLIQPFYGYVKEQVAYGSKASVIFRTIKKQGFSGSYAVVRESVARLKKRKQTPSETNMIQRSTIISCFWKCGEKTEKKERYILQAVLTEFPETKPVYAFVQLFRTAFSTNNLQDFLECLQFFKREEVKEIQRFLKTMNDELDAVEASFLYPFNTSIVEGQINRLKLIKRMMYV